MHRFALFAIALTTPAIAMPSDLPWETYACTGGQIIEVKFLSDGLAISVRIGGEDSSILTLLPVDEEKQAGFKDGDYKGDGDALLVLKDKAITLTGTGITGAPFENCTFVVLPPPG